MAEVLDLSTQYLTRLKKNGVCPNIERGWYELIPTVKRYIQHLRGGQDDQETEGLNKHVLDCKLTQERIFKTQKENEKLDFQLEVEKGEYTPNNKIREDILRISSALKAGFLRFESDMPPMLAGLSESQMQKVLRAKIDELLGQFADLGSELYKD